MILFQTPETDATGKVEESELNTFIQEKFNVSSNF